MLTRTTKRALWALACLLLSHACLAQNTLTVESFPAVNESMTTFRFYVNISNPSDRVSAVYGNAEDPMERDVLTGQGFQSLAFVQQDVHATARFFATPHESLVPPKGLNAYSAKCWR